MMTLQYNGVDLGALGTLRVLGRTTMREPAEAPQRERVTYRLRLDFFEQTFQGQLHVEPALPAQRLDPD